MQLSKTRRWRMPIIAGALLLAACGPDTCLGAPPSGKIAAASKTDDCKQDVTAALRGFAKSRGMAYEVSAEDAQKVLDSGRVDKFYTRDSERYGAYFGIDASEGKCQLHLYRTRRPSRGGYTLSATEFRTPLKRCKCQ